MSHGQQPTRLATSRPTVHLVFPHGDRTSSPDAIGRELGKRLEAQYSVVYHDWFEEGVVVPKPGDVLVGHPHPDPQTIFRRSLEQNGWRRRLMLAPFHHGDLRQVAFVESILPKCDLFLAITGPYWFRTVASSPCSHWLPKMVHLDLAIDRGAFPPLKKSFGAAGSRKVLYIGRSGRGKNTPYLSQIAARIPEAEFAWIGPGQRPIRGLTHLGFVDFDAQVGRDLLAQFDFFLTVGNADANPMTILEAMSWGLIPVCTPTSGYDGIGSIFNVPVADVGGAAEVIRSLMWTGESELLAAQSANWQLLDSHYNWDRFAAVVTDAIESTASPALTRPSAKRRLTFAFHDITSPYGRIAYSPAGKLASKLRHRLRHKLRPGVRSRLSRRVRRTGTP